MKKLAILGAFFLGFGAFAMSAQNYDPEAVITQVGDRQWTVTWEDYDSINPLNCVADENEENRAYLDDGTDTPIYLYFKKQIIIPDYANYFTVNLAGMDLADGNYDLMIPAGYVATLPGTQPCEAQVLRLTIGNTSFSHDVKFTNINDNAFSIYWDGVVSLEPGNTTGAYIINTSSNKKYDMLFLEDYAYSKANLMIDGYYLKVNLTNNYPDLPSGNYKLYIPANYVLFNGSSAGNDAIDGYEFSYVEPWKEGPVTMEGPTEDGLITLTWTEATAVAYNTNYAGDGWGTTGVSVFDGEDNKIDVPYPSNISFKNNVMTINLSGLNIVAGNCQLVVPEDYVLVTKDGKTELSSEFAERFIYSTSGVAGIEAENGIFTVYGLNGVKILETKNAADLRNLPKGMYIVNGKKVAR